jgi:hypothetical protein
MEILREAKRWKETNNKDCRMKMNNKMMMVKMITNK